ncbi:hypothetical protein BH09PLA1_BH09PLA1_21600 [soil metagenome]
MRSNARSYASVLVLSLACSGCGGGGGEQGAGVKGLSQNEADRLNSNRSTFDQPGDPAFTADTRFAAGQLAEAQNVPAGAIEQYREALKVNPKHQPSLYRLAVVLTQQKAYPQAVDTWKKYIAATGNSASGYSNLAFCYELWGKTAEAEREYQAGIGRDPKSEPCRVNYGLMLARTGRVEEGRTQLEAVLKPAQAAYNIGSVLEQLGRKDLAREEYSKALKLEPGFQQAQARLAALN